MTETFVVEAYSGGAIEVEAGPFGFSGSATAYGQKCLGASAADATEIAMAFGVDGEVQQNTAARIDRYRVVHVEDADTPGRVVAEGP